MDKGNAHMRNSDGAPTTSRVNDRQMTDQGTELGMKEDAGRKKKI